MTAPTSKPTTYPDLAINDVYNGVLGAINVQEPPSGIKTDGYNYGQKPPREYFNWYGRIYNLWFKHLDARTDEVDSYFTSQW